MRAIAAAIVVILVGALAAGCGSESEGAEHKEFASQANAICEEAGKRAASEFKALYARPKAKQPKTEAKTIEDEVKHWVPVLAKEAKAQRDGIQELDPPSGGEKQLEAILAAYGEWLQKADATPLQVVIANDLYDNARELAGKLGLARCEETAFQVIEG